MRGTCLLLLVPLLGGSNDASLEPVRKAIGKTGESSYAYHVRGRFDRSGEFRPPDLLTSRIKQYRAVRRGKKLLVKGIEGLWLAPGERAGERSGRPPQDDEAIRRTLREAAPPHRMLEELLAIVKHAHPPQDREISGELCRRYRLIFDRDKLKAALERQMQKSIAAGTLEKPDATLWTSLKGYLYVYVSRKHGRLLKVSDVRSVKLAYGKEREPRYENELTLEFSSWGKATASIPSEVKEKLAIEK